MCKCVKGVLASMRVRARGRCVRRSRPPVCRDGRVKCIAPPSEPIALSNRLLMLLRAKYSRAPRALRACGLDRQRVLNPENTPDGRQRRTQELHRLGVSTLSVERVCEIHLRRQCKLMVVAEFPTMLREHLTLDRLGLGTSPLQSHAIRQVPLRGVHVVHIV